jgi:hypothetical protein
MSDGTSAECCPRFDPEPWDAKEIRWENKLFVKDRVTCILHVPLGFGSLVKRNMVLIEAAGAVPETRVIVSDDNSRWGADVYIAVTKDVPGAKMATVTGTYLSKVFEGPYRNMGKWVEEMAEFVRASGKKFQRFYSVYTTCPKCAKKYGENYVVMLAQV